jgi:eukaryotic-like serine/threonine-protein kinase
MRQVGGYELVRLLGEGGMGRVYLARSPAGGGLVAVKLIRTNVANQETFRRRFRSEVARARQVPPFCTAEVLDADPDHDPPYLVVEYVDGPDLATVVRERGPFSPANLHGLAIGVATALTAIHGAGVIHRDLKAANVLLAPGSPKVIDFGLARVVDPADAAAANDTSTGELVGTVAYMAPERIDPIGRELTPAADIFAWGGVVAFAGTGRVPFAAETLPALATRILTGPPDLDGLTGDLRELVQEALAKDPAERPTARELLDRLLTSGSRGGGAPADQTELLRTGRQHAHVDPDDPGIETAVYRQPPPTLAAGRGRRRTLLLLVLCAILAVGVAAGLTLWQVGTAADPIPASTAPPPPASAPAALIPAGAQLIVRDQLAAAGRWEVTVHEPGTVCDFADALMVTSEEASFRCRGPVDIMSDVAVWVDVTLLEPGSCATVWFRFTVADGGYALRVCEEAFYLVTHGAPESDSVRTLREFWFDAPVTGTTRVGIVADGADLRFYRDGALVGGWSDSTFPTGRIGLGLLQMRPEVRPPYRVSFTNIEVYGSAG